MEQIRAGVGGPGADKLACRTSAHHRKGASEGWLLLLGDTVLAQGSSGDGAEENPDCLGGLQLF